MASHITEPLATVDANSRPASVGNAPLRYRLRQMSKARRTAIGSDFVLIPIAVFSILAMVDEHSNRSSLAATTKLFQTAQLPHPRRMTGVQRHGQVGVLGRHSRIPQFRNGGDKIGQAIAGLLTR
jgi:hypothetical protein